MTYLKVVVLFIKCERAARSGPALAFFFNFFISFYILRTSSVVYKMPVRCNVQPWHRFFCVFFSCMLVQTAFIPSSSSCGAKRMCVCVYTQTQTQTQTQTHTHTASLGYTYLLVSDRPNTIMSVCVCVYTHTHIHTQLH